MPSNVQIPAPFSKWYTINEAAEAMQYKHSQYVRKLLKEGKLGSYVKVLKDDDGRPVFTSDGAYQVVSGGKIKLMVGKTPQWRINPAACAAYKARAAQSGGTFGQHSIRRMTLRFATEHFTIEEIQAALQEALGPTEVEADEGESGFRWELAKAWKGGSKKKKSATKKGAPQVATIISSLVNSDEDDEDDEDEWDEDEDWDDLDDSDEDDDDDEDDLDDILS